MALNILFVLAICSELVSGLAHEAPTATLYDRGWDFNGLGWSPAPTNPPASPQELVKRGLLAGRQLASTILVGEGQTCGYLSGSAGAVYTCGDPTSTCNLLPAIATNSYGAIACCARGQCYGRLYCINSAEYFSSSACNDVCQANTFTLKCTEAAAPFCNTAVWDNPKVRDVYCAARSVSTSQTIFTTYSGQTSGGTFSPLALDESSTILSTSRSTTRSSSSSSSTTSSSSSSTSTIPPSPTPIPPGPGSSTPIGAIVGGTVGGVALIAAIAFGVFFVRRRNRKDKLAAAGGPVVAVDNHNSQPPPVYIPPQSEMDGSGKSPMTHGYYAPGAAAAGGYQGQQHQRNSGMASPGASDGGFEPRRESTISPTSPQTQYTGTATGSPHLSESYITTNHGGYPPPPAAHEIGAPVAPTTYEISGTPIHR